MNDTRYLKKICKDSKKIVCRKGKKCGILGNEKRFYENMTSKGKSKPMLSDAIKK